MFFKIRRSDESYMLLEAQIGDVTSGLELRCMLHCSDKPPVEFCVGTVEPTETGQWLVTAAAEYRDGFDVRDVGTFHSLEAAADALWGQRLWFHWNYLH